MTPPTCELFRTLLRRALGRQSAPASMIGAVALGVLGGWVAARCHAAGVGDRTSSGLLAWLVVRFPHTAMYGLGSFAALQLVAAYDEDARTGWTPQYLAAGGSRDRYILALAGAGACATGLLYLLAVAAWLAAATALGRPVSLLPASTALVPVAIAWQLSATAFAAAAVALAGSAGRALGLMGGVVLLPWVALAALRPDPSTGAPAWIAWLTLLSPPYPVSPDVATAFLLAVYPGLLLALAWLLAPRRLLRL